MVKVKIARGHSCVSCQHPKIRCSRQALCEYCSRTTQDGVRPLLRDAQAADSRNGLVLKNQLAAPDTTTPPSSGRVVVSGDQRRHVGDNRLRASLDNEIEEEEESKPPKNGRLPQELPSSNIDLISGRQTSDSPSMLHPSAVQSFRLWQVFTSNVHPLTRVLHGPSVQEELLRSLAEPSSTDGPTEALIFSIYLIAVVSLTDAECRNLLGETREKHLARYRRATEAALIRVDFLGSTELKVLQAFTLYLLSLGHLCDQDTLWLLTGLAARMGQRMGMHRESSLRNLSPFEAELRRRVWWQIVVLDGRAAQLTGAAPGPESRLCGSNTNPPAGVSDGDLVPSMSSLPRPPHVPTEMVFCSVRIEIGVWMIRQKGLLGRETTPSDRTELLRSIDELEGLLEERYLRHINSDIPLSLLTTHLARSTVCQLRLSVYQPIHRPEKAASCMDPEQLDLLLENSLEVVRHDVAAHTARSLQRFAWHVSNVFPFEAFILLINTLSRVPASPVAGAAWSVIDRVFEHHPRFASDTGDPLYWALGSITLKAWGRRVSGARAGSLGLFTEPPCVRELVRRRAALCRRPQSIQETPTATKSTGLTKPQGPQGVKDMPGYDGCDVEASQPQPLQRDGATAGATGDQIFCIADDTELDWGFWQELLDGNAQARRDTEETYSFPFFTSKS